MDLSALPDLVQHFSFAVQFMPDVVQHGVDQVRNVAAAFGEHSPYSPSEKIYHAGKFAVLGGLFIFTLSTVNVEGMLGAGIAQADEFYELSRQGQKARLPGPPLA